MCKCEGGSRWNGDHMDIKNGDRIFVITKWKTCDGNIITGFSTMPSIYKYRVLVCLSGTNEVWYSSVLCLIFVDPLIWSKNLNFLVKIFYVRTICFWQFHCFLFCLVLMDHETNQGLALQMLTARDVDLIAAHHQFKTQLNWFSALTFCLSVYWLCSQNHSNYLYRKAWLSFSLEKFKDQWNCQITALVSCIKLPWCFSGFYLIQSNLMFNAINTL